MCPLASISKAATPAKLKTSEIRSAGSSTLARSALISRTDIQLRTYWLGKSKARERRANAVALGFISMHAPMFTLLVWCQQGTVLLKFLRAQSDMPTPGRTDYSC